MPADLHSIHKIPECAGGIPSFSGRRARCRTVRQVSCDLDQLRAVYGVAPDTVFIRDQGSTFAAIEALVRVGAGVIFAQPTYTGQPDRQFDTHRDRNGEVARKIMAPITPMLTTFLDRVMALPDRNVVTMLVGEWSRTNPESDHEPGGTATVIGKYVRTGTPGPQNTDGSPPASAPPAEALWAFA